MKKITIILRMISIFLVFLLTSGLFWNKSEMLSQKTLFEPKFSSLAPMLDKVIPSVVSISVEGNLIKSSRIPRQLQSLSYYGILNHAIRHEKFRALGSGVIIDSKNGYVVTNNHVVDRAEKINVQLNNGFRYTAVTIGKDTRFDIALLKLKKFNHLHEIKIANSDLLRVGDYVIAIGNPYGLGETVTSGIVSALHRSGLNIENYENFIQTDAAINRGNSGGALINLKGELVGINTAILAPDGGNIGIGFAIPINMVQNLVTQMLKYGQVKRNELGIIGVELNSDLSKAMKINVQRGAFVSQVLSKSSADMSGIKPGDVIISLNKKPIVSFSALRAEIASFPINTKIELELFRDGKVRLILVELKPKIRNNIDSSVFRQSISGANLSNFYFNGEKKGIRVNYVKNGTPADHMGLKKNDIIFEINKHYVSSLDEFQKILCTKPTLLVFHIKRGNDILYLVVH